MAWIPYLARVTSWVKEIMILVCRGDDKVKRIS